MARPTGYKPEYCELVIEFGKEGKSKTQMASELEVCRNTLDNWANENPEFLSALTRASTHAQAWWETKGQTGMEADKFNASVWSRSMAARFPADWREVSRQEQTGKDGGPIQSEARLDLSNLTLEQKRALASIKLPGVE